MPRPKSNKPKKGFLEGYKTYDPNDNIGYGDVNQWRNAWERMTGKEAADILNGEKAMEIMDFATMPTKSQLGTRYRELMQKHHPDHGGDMATARKIIAAFTILSELVKE